MRRVDVETESGNVYRTWSIGGAHPFPVVLWIAEQRRDHDLELPSPASGVVLAQPRIGESMILAWVHPERGPQIRRTSLVASVSVQEEFVE